MITRSPLLARCAAAPLTQMSPPPGSPSITYVANRDPVVTLYTSTRSYGTSPAAFIR
jgi:hypothetical protein